MKTTIVSLLLSTALIGATVASADDQRPTRATATVELIDPEHFTDFKTKRFSSEKDVQALARDLRREVNRQAAKNLPEGYQVMLRIRDIDLAGDFEPQQLPPNDDIRIMRGVYVPRIKLEYSVSDAQGNVVATGERTLTDLGYEHRLRIRPENPLDIEAEMFGAFFREIARAVA